VVPLKFLPPLELEQTSEHRAQAMLASELTLELAARVTQALEPTPVWVAQETPELEPTLELAVQVTQDLEHMPVLAAMDTEVSAQDSEALAVFSVVSASAARLELAATAVWVPTLAVTAREA
jgi:hypothetical protein